GAIVDSGVAGNLARFIQSKRVAERPTECEVVHRCAVVEEGIAVSRSRVGITDHLAAAVQRHRVAVRAAQRAQVANRSLRSRRTPGSQRKNHEQEPDRGGCSGAGAKCSWKSLLDSPS